MLEDKVLEVVIRNVLELNSEKTIHDELMKLRYKVEKASRTFSLAVVQLEQRSEVSLLLEFNTPIRLEVNVEYRR